MNLRKMIFAATTAMTLATSSVLPGAAQDVNNGNGATATSAVSITGGDFTVALDAKNFDAVDYELGEQTTGNGGITLTVSDLTGTGKGWQVKVTTTDFIGEDKATTIPVENLDAAEPTFELGDPNSQPIVDGSMDANAFPKTDSSPAGYIWTANEGYGQGVYKLNVSGTLTIPARMLAQTYTATATVEIVSAP